MSSSSSVAKAKRRVVSLQGTRPLPVSVPTATSPPRTSKRPRVVNNKDDDVRARRTGPVILYEHTPKVIHARPDEFMALVQRLTGRQPTGTTTDGGDQGHQEAVLPPAPAQTTAVASSSSSIQQVQEQDPLVLTLGQQVPLPPPFPLDDHHPTPPELPSPGGAGAGAGFLLSPENFLFSPTTMQAIHELMS